MTMDGGVQAVKVIDHDRIYESRLTNDVIQDWDSPSCKMCKNKVCIIPGAIPSILDYSNKLILYFLHRVQDLKGFPIVFLWLLYA